MPCCPKHSNFLLVERRGKNSRATQADVCNGFLDHGNYIAYGYASVALCGLGISFSLPLLHGQNPSGGVGFDLADVIKDALVMPTGFLSALLPKSRRRSFAKRLLNAASKLRCWTTFLASSKSCVRKMIDAR